MNVVISQSMYFPWVGFLEQLRLADVFVLYDDVQFSKGSFTNRVQIKTESGLRWLTVPLSGLRLGHHIDEIQVKSSSNWHHKHRELLVEAYHKAPYFTEMLALVDSVFSKQLETLSDIAFASTLALAEYYGLTFHLRQYSSKNLGIPGSGSQRVLDIVRTLGGQVYITGHGAKNYIDHAAFEQEDIIVHYMNYQCNPYPQLHGEFNPFVSALDLVANCGLEGARYIKSPAIEWKKFLNESS